MQDDSIPTWEMPPGSNPEKKVSEEDQNRAEDFEKTLEDVPFAGENAEIMSENPGEGSEFDNGMNDAAKLLGYINGAPLGDESLDAVADAIMNLDGGENNPNPVGELKDKLGFGAKTAEEIEARRKELAKSEFAGNENASEAIDYPNKTSADSRAAFGAALNDFKEWVNEVRGDDPKYAWARENAMNAGIGVFDYLKKYTGAKGLADVFKILSTHEDEIEEENVTDKDQDDEGIDDDVEAKLA